MKTLLVMRHAKSDRNDASLQDHDRPLAERGREDVPRIGGWLRSQGLVPDYVVCSSARRTRDTLELLLPVLGDAEVVVDEALYLASASALHSQVRGLPDSAERALLIGHNPGVNQLVVHLVGRSPRRRQVEAGFPTAALAVLGVPTGSWGELEPGTAELNAVVTPASLR